MLASYFSLLDLLRFQRIVSRAALISLSRRMESLVHQRSVFCAVPPCLNLLCVVQHLGRIICCGAMLVGAVVMAVLTATVSSKLSLNAGESRLMLFLQSERWEKEIRLAAIRSVQSWWRRSISHPKTLAALRDFRRETSSHSRTNANAHTHTNEHALPCAHMQRHLSTQGVGEGGEGGQGTEFLPGCCLVIAVFIVTPSFYAQVSNRKRLGSKHQLMCRLFLTCVFAGSRKSSTASSSKQHLTSAHS